jgi:colanic acid biosynthesis glycosyl transferase WcaI
MAGEVWMRIVVLSLYFTPDVAANAVIVGELCRGLAALGHQVRAVAAFPHYDQNRIWEAYRGKLVQRERGDGIDVYRTYLYVPRRKERIVGRLLNYASFTALSALVGLAAGPCDAVLVPSPPLTLGLSGYLVSRLRGVPFVYNVQDIYPDVAVRLGVLKNPRLIRFFRRMEDFVYAKAAAVTVLSEGFRLNLLSKRVPEHKLRVIPNFADTGSISPQPKDNAFSREHGLHDRFVAMYAGNVGLSQGLEVLLEAAEKLQDLADLRVLIVGNGAAKAALESRVAEMALQNVVMLPFQPREVLAQMYACADVSLVVLRKGIGAESVPSKAYTIMASGRPMVAAVDAETETRWLIDAAGCGLGVEPEDPVALAAAIRQLYQDPAARARMGEDGREYVLANHTPQVVARRYGELFTQIAGSG